MSRGEGVSISGWGADMLRYREIYRHMAAGVPGGKGGGERADARRRLRFIKQRDGQIVL